MVETSDPLLPLLERLARLDTGQVSDVLDEAGLPHHALASNAFRPVGPAVRFAGVAVCARGEPIVHGLDPRPGLPMTVLDRAVIPGAVVVLDAGGYVGGACVGGFVVSELRRLGCRGLVVNGAVRDVREIAELGLPTFSTAVTPVNASRRWTLVDVGKPVALPCQTVASVMVSPGDLVLGDADGIVVVDRKAALTVVEDAEALAAIEARIGDAMRAGSSRSEAFAQNPRVAHIRRVGGPGT